MKKKYFSPELDIFKLKFSEVLAITPSEYNPDPQDPTRDGTDDPSAGDL